MTGSLRARIGFGKKKAIRMGRQMNIGTVPSGNFTKIPTQNAKQAKLDGMMLVKKKTVSAKTRKAITDFANYARS